MVMEIVTRSEALEKGLTFYFTGRKCLRGGVARRYINGACTCKECADSRAKVARESKLARAGSLSESGKTTLETINSIFR